MMKILYNLNNIDLIKAICVFNLRVVLLKKHEKFLNFGWECKGVKVINRILIKPCNK